MIASFLRISVTGLNLSHFLIYLHATCLLPASWLHSKAGGKLVESKLQPDKLGFEGVEYGENHRGTQINTDSIREIEKK